MSAKKASLILFFALLIVVAVELYNLTAVSLWHDESFSALLVKYDFGEMIERIKMDVHPPLYYIILKGWDYLFGNSLFSLRFFSVLFSALAIITFYFFVKFAFKNRNLALFSSLLFAFSYFQIQYAMEARMYSLGTFLVIISTFLFLKALETKKWNWWLLYAFYISCGIYTHYFIALWIIPQALYLLYYLYKESKFNFSSWFKNKNFQFGTTAYILTAISYIPWLGTFLKQLGQVQADYWIPKINIWSIPNTFSKMTIGGTIDSSRFWYVLAILMVIVIFLIVFFLKRSQLKEKWLILFLLVVPFLLTIFLSVKRPIYIDRYFIFGFPFYALFVAGAALLIKNKWIKNSFIAFLLLGSLITFPLQWQSLKVETRSGMAGAANYLNQNFKPDEKIFVGSSLIYFTFKYYNQTSAPPLLYAPGHMPHYSGTALLSPEDIIIDFNEETKKDDIVWMVNTTGFGNYQPEIPENWIKISEEGFQCVYDYLGWIIISKYKVKEFTLI